IFRCDRNQCSSILGKAGSAPTKPSAKEAGTNAGVQPYTSRHLDDVCADPLAKAGNFIGEADLHGQEGIGRILDHLGAGGIGRDQWRLLTRLRSRDAGWRRKRLLEDRAVELLERAESRLAFCTDDDAIGVKRIVERVSLTQKLRIGREDRKSTR